MPVPRCLQKRMSLHQLVEQYWDLSAIPKKFAFCVLANVSEDKIEKEKCLEFCTPEGQEDFYNYCNRPRRNILEVLEDFVHSTSKLTIDSLFELFTPIKPRSFSIASSCRVVENKQIDVLVAVVKYYTKLKEERLGLCSNWMKGLNVGDRVYGWVTKGTFVFTQQEITPMILIGPGTGLAPFRSLVLEMESLNTAHKDRLVLFFGCRNENGDFHCAEDLKRLESEGKLKLICAFSRDQEDKIYVQHKIQEHSSLIWKLLSETRASIFIAGNSKNMPNNVKDSIVENVLVKEGSMGEGEALSAIKQLEDIGRLQLETW